MTAEPLTAPEKLLHTAPAPLTRAPYVNPHGPTSGALQGDDYQLEYHDDGYPKLPLCLDSQAKASNRGGSLIMARCRLAVAYRALDLDHEGDQHRAELQRMSASRLSSRLLGGRRPGADCGGSSRGAGTEPNQSERLANLSLLASRASPPTIRRYDAA